MTTSAHVAPEEVMAWVDGELGAAEARDVAAHVEACAECAGVAAQFRRLSEEMGAWSVAEIPERVDAAVMSAAEGAKGYPHGRLRRTLRRAQGRLWGTPVRWLGGAVAAMVVMLVSTQVLFHAHESRPAAMMMVAPQPQNSESLRAWQSQSVSAIDGLASSSAMNANAPMPDAPVSSDVASMRGAQAMMRARSSMPEKLASASSVNGAELEHRMAGPPPAAAAPMIARTVSLTVRVQDVEQSRAAVEALLARHRGYASQMNASSAVGSARVFTASLRIPAAELAAALQELRGLGHVENESQSGDEVTQQHQDLVARLKNSRETEARLQAILQQQSGRISDVLEVEQEIARVRGEIESMEAEQAGLEHRVDFASVEIALAEQYKAEFRAPDSVGAQLRNAFVTGLGNARDAVLGIVLFAEEYGPALLVWCVVLGLPGWWMWRRWQRVRGAI
jgi:DNA-binding transcriptional regulator YhcF (GntR family)